jgi:hypothetical protein
MKKLSIWTAFTLLFGAAGPGLAQATSDTSLNRIVTQIESMFPSDTDGLVLSVDADTLTLDLRLGQSIKRGDRLHLIRFGEKIVHPTTKKKIGRKETDLGQVEIIEVRRDFSLARLIDPSVQAQPGDGVRSTLKKQLSFLVAPPQAKAGERQAGEQLRLTLETKLNRHPRFKVPDFDLELWLLENNLDHRSLLRPGNLAKLKERVAVDYLLLSEIRPVKGKLVLDYRLFSAVDGALQKQAKVLTGKPPVPPRIAQEAFGDQETQTSLQPRGRGLVRFLDKHEFRFKIVDLDVGDINGDGKKEVVVITPTQVVVLNYEESRLKPMARFKADSRDHRFLAVDVGDINRNGRDEIFVTDHYGEQLASFALEIHPNTQRLEQIWQDVNLYFRIIHPFGTRPILMAQAPGFKNPFKGPIMRYTFKGNQYAPRSQLRVPTVDGTKPMLYGLTRANLKDDKAPETIMLDDDFHLRVYSHEGRLLVKSDDYFGRDPRSIRVGVVEDISIMAPPEGATLINQSEPVGFKGRLELIKQGESRYLLLPLNHTAGGKLFPGFASVENSSLAILSIAREGLAKVFETRKQRGYLAGLHSFPAQNGQPEQILVVTVEEKAEGGRDRSIISSYAWQTSN